MPPQATATPSAGRAGYVVRFNQVVDYIDAHLSEPLDLHTLAAVAHFSPWHFHRLFQAMMGETVAECVRRRRLEAAASLLLASPPAAVQAIALDAGFGSAAVFARSFKAHFGVTPGAWRQGAHRSWTHARRSQLREIHQAFRTPDRAGHHPAADAAPGRLTRSRSTEAVGSMPVELKILPSIRVAYMRHVGPYGDPGIGRLWQRFLRWAMQHHLPDGNRLLVGVSHDSADIAMPDRCRYDACVEITSSFRPQREIGTQPVQGGLCACTRFTGSGDDIYAAWLRLYVAWLPDSGYQPDDRPCIEVYGAGAVVDAKTGSFSCELCLPVKPV